MSDNARLKRAFIYGQLPSLNEYIEACRKSPREGAAMKREAQDFVGWQLKRELGTWRTPKRISIDFTYIEPNKKRDPDNIGGFARKVILDSLVELGKMTNDGWRNICSFHEHFCTNHQDPMIIVDIYQSE